MAKPQFPFEPWEALLRQDPGSRGVSNFRHEGKWLAPGAWKSAAESLAAGTGAVAIVTGFAVPLGEQVVGETDGPPGALFLARALLELGREVWLISDEYGRPLLECGCDLWQLGRDKILTFPFDSAHPQAVERQSYAVQDSPQSLAWVASFFADGPGGKLSHLISVERAGPSHTLDSFLAQPRQQTAPLAQFEQEIAANSRNVCHNMRGTPINQWTAKTHLLWDHIQHHNLPIVTLGIGDGGNELGMGSLPWEVLCRAIRQGPAGRIACRVAASHCVLAGVSNWGAYALALAVCALTHQLPLAAAWSCAEQQALIDELVQQTGAIDGVTCQHSATVDGLTSAVYASVLGGLRQSLGFSP